MQMIEIAMSEGQFAEAYVARPGGDDGGADGRDADDSGADGSGAGDPGGGVPGVVLFMDAIGLRPRIAEMAQRIADWGHVVLAPNVFFREGRAQELAPTQDLRAPGAREEFFALASPRVQRLTPGLAEGDIPTYLDALRALPGVSAGPIGVTGYCMGARLAVRAANLDPGVAAVGGFHGGGLATGDADSPHRGLGSARAEFVFGHADGDRSMGPEAVATLGEALTSAGLVARNEIYEGASHGYSMADTSVFDEAATERHFAELEALFGRTLGARRS